MLHRQKISIEIWQRMLHPLCSAKNRKTIGLFKDELNSVPMQRFVALRPKCYAFHCTGKVSNSVLQHTNHVERKRAKGDKRRVKDAHLDFGCTKQLSYIALSTEPDQVYLAHCAYSSHVQGRHGHPLSIYPFRTCPLSLFTNRH